MLFCWPAFEVPQLSKYKTRILQVSFGVDFVTFLPEALKTRSRFPDVVRGI